MELFLKLEISQYVNTKIIFLFSLKIDLWLILSTYCIGTQSLYCLYKMFILIDIELFDKSQMTLLFILDTSITNKSTAWRAKSIYTGNCHGTLSFLEVIAYKFCEIDRKLYPVFGTSLVGSLIFNIGLHMVLIKK